MFIEASSRNVAYQHSLARFQLLGSYPLHVQCFGILWVICAGLSDNVVKKMVCK